MNAKLLSTIHLLLILTACKTAGSGSNPLLIGGVASEKLPQVGILAKQGEMHCTATLIAPQRVVTAAHCVAPWEKKKDAAFTFQIGPTLLRSRATRVIKLVSHPLYNPESGAHDIAYADLEAPLELKPLPVLQQTLNLPGQRLHLLGYGRSSSPQQGHDGSSGTKREGTTIIHSFNAGKIRAELEGSSSCNGDSGGPAFIDVDGEWKIAGIVSCGDATCTSYGVYTRASEYLQFLGLKTEVDPQVDLPSCEGVGRRGRCEKDVLFRCSDDCFEAKATRINCALAPAAGRCHVLKTSEQAVCADSSWKRQTLQVLEVSKVNGSISITPYAGIEAFIDGMYVDAGSRSLLVTDEKGRIQEDLSPGRHFIQFKSIYSSHNIAISAATPLPSPQEDELGALSVYTGRVPTEIKVSYSTAADEALYITGESPLLGNWKTARMLTPTSEGWVYRDNLARDLEYKIVKAKKQTPEIKTSAARLESGPNRKLSKLVIFVGFKESIQPKF